MSEKSRAAAIFIGLCCALAGCDGTPAADPVGLEPEAGILDTRNVASLAPNTWATKRSMPVAQHRSVAGAISNIVYVVGGTRADGTVTNAVYAYNTATNTWSRRAPLPSRRTELNGASAINGRLYVTGGFNSSGSTPTRTLYEYNPVTDTWARKADVPQASACGAQGAIGDLLYVYTAGTECGFDEHRFFRYNPATNTWATLASPPTTHHWGVGGVTGGKFYLAGGRDDVLDVNLALEVYTPATNSWRSRARMPSEQLRAAGGVLGGKLHVAGGGQVGTPLATLRVYDPATNRWTTKAPMPTARWATFGVNANGLLWVIGGLQNNNSGATRKVEAYTP